MPVPLVRPRKVPPCAGIRAAAWHGVQPAAGAPPTQVPATQVRIAAMALGAFRTTVDRRAYHLAGRNGHHAYTWRNTNLLLGSYAGADGIKTGFTLAAGYCLLFEAHRGTSVLIGVVLHSTATTPGRRFTYARRMPNWGFGVLAASAALTGRLGPPGR